MAHGTLRFLSFATERRMLAVTVTSQRSLSGKPLSPNGSALPCVADGSIWGTVTPPSSARGLHGVRVAIIYDCLFPCTLGGVERWYRNLVDQLLAEGALITYVTRRQWTGSPPNWPGVNIESVSSDLEIYDEEGTRRVLPSIKYGLGVFWWCLRNRQSIDVVMTANFPFFSVLGARLALLGARTTILVDFYELWSSDYWKRYAGRVAGRIGHFVQNLCVMAAPRIQVYHPELSSHLRERGYTREITVLPGLFPATGEINATLEPPPDVTVLYVGRLIQHKGVQILPDVLHELLVTHPTSRMVIVGEGPERARLEARCAELSISDHVTFSGRVADEDLEVAYRSASCTIVPSLREGYGLVVAESASAGTPVVVFDNPENLAVSLIDRGVNGFVSDPNPRSAAELIAKCSQGGRDLRTSTLRWFQERSVKMSMEESAKVVIGSIQSSLRRSL